MKFFRSLVIVSLVLFLDQASKLLVHYNMKMGVDGQIKLIGDWLKLFYTLNPGMAFGMEFGFKYGKFFLTFVRVVASLGMLVYLYYVCVNRIFSFFDILCWSFIAGGGIGNTIDCVFYGEFLGNAPSDSITKWFHGQVVDMIYLDMFVYKIPDWLPFCGGEYIKFFPIFNLADFFISVGIILIFLKGRLFRFFIK